MQENENVSTQTTTQPAYKILYNFDMFRTSSVFGIIMHDPDLNRERMDILPVNSKSEFLEKITLIDRPQILAYYERCLAESTKTENADSFYLLSKELLNGINIRYQADRFPTKPAEIQLKLNKLYEHYYVNILDAMKAIKPGEPCLVAAGEEHYTSLVDNLIIWDILKNTGSFKCLFLEQDEDFIIDMSKPLPLRAFHGNHSFEYLTILAQNSKIPVIPIEDKKARALQDTAKDEKADSLSVDHRDMHMAKNFLEKQKSLPEGFYFLLCGAEHLPTLKKHLNKAGYYNIISINTLDASIESFSNPSLFGFQFILLDPNFSGLQVKKIRKFNGDKSLIGFENTLDLHAAVLTARSSCLQKIGPSLAPIEKINPLKLKEKIQNEQENKGAFIADNKYGFYYRPRTDPASSSSSSAGLSSITSSSSASSTSTTSTADLQNTKDDFSVTELDRSTNPN